MKSSHAALVVVGLALVGLWYTAGGSVAPQAAAAEPRVSAPVSHDNLTVFFVHGPDAITNAKIVTLQEALEAGWAVVHETGDVNRLAVENLSSDYELFIQDGDMIRGGKQDRVIAVDMLVPPRSGQVPFPAHCVESGRWTSRGGEAVTHFNKSDQFAVGNDLRYANASGQQGEVWKNVEAQQRKLSDNLGVKVNAKESESSLQLALENPAVQAKVAEFEQALRAAGEKRPNVIGVVFVLNGQVYGHEEYGSNALFLKAWPKLLKSAAANAVAEKTAKATPPAPGVREVERFLAYGGPAGGAADPQNRARDERAGAPLQNPVPGIDVGNIRIANDVLQSAERIEQTEDGVRITFGDGNRANNTVSETRLRQIAETWSGRGPEDRARTIAELTRDLPARYRPMVEEYFRQLNRANGQPATNDDLTRAIDNIRILQGREESVANPESRVQASRFDGWDPAPAVASPASSQGNRLNVNRVDGAAGLVTESRDPARQNAVIHKSFIKK